MTDFPSTQQFFSPSQDCLDRQLVQSLVNEELIRQFTEISIAARQLKRVAAESATATPNTDRVMPQVQDLVKQVAVMQWFATQV